MSITTLDQLTPQYRRALGLLVAGLGLGVAVLVYLYPERLRAPIWLVLVACGCFVLGGVAIGLFNTISRRAYAWLIVALVSALTVLPAWIALGPGTRRCSASWPFLGGDMGCRAMFFAAAVLMFCVLRWVIGEACRGTKSDRNDAPPDAR